MAFRHGKNAAISVDAKLLSAFCDNAEFGVEAALADVTTFGSTWTSAIKGLLSGTLTLSGSYDPTATTGPSAVLWAAMTADTASAVIYYPGGNTTGQRSYTFSAFISNYKESAAVADKVTFSADFTITGAVVGAVI